MRERERDDYHREREREIDNREEKTKKIGGKFTFDGRRFVGFESREREE